MSTIPLINKTIKVIRSCKTMEQLKTAQKFAILSSEQLKKLHYKIHRDEWKNEWYGSDWKILFGQEVKKRKEEICQDW